MDKRVLGVIAGVGAALVRDIGQRLRTRANRGLARGKRFLIVGGGFGGVEAARELERLLPGEDNGELVLVNQTDHLLFTPMLTEAVGGGIEPHHVIVPLGSFFRRTKVVIGEVQNIDLASRSISIRNAVPPTVAANHLVIALGASSNFHHTSGAEQNAITMKTLEDAERVNQGARALVKRAALERDSAEREAMLTFVVAGGGYTGVETIAALNELVRQTARNEAIADADLHMVIVEPLDRLMSEVTPDLAAYTQKQLEKDGIRVVLKTGVKNVEGDLIELSNGEKIRARTFIWSAGVEANKLVAELDVPKDKSKALKVTADLALQQFAGVWAIGDSAAIPRPDGQGTYGATAQNATREGTLVARNIVARLKGQPGKNFTYTPIGELALVGKRRGVARVYHFNFSGFLAYIMWRAVYLAKMPSMTQRLRVVSDWVLDFALGSTAKYRFSAPALDGAKITPSKSTAASAR